MPRPVTLFTAQWADLPFETMCQKLGSWGYDGAEIACWGEHMQPRLGATDPRYIEGLKRNLADNRLHAFALGAHLAGQCVGDPPDPRADSIVPPECRGSPEKIRAWGIQEMKYTAQAARNLGCKVVTGFMGSPIWRYWYSFPPTTEKMIDDGFKEIFDLWSPILDEFDRCGVKFALEIHPTEIAYDHYTTARLLKEFKDRPTLGFNFDPSHFWQGMKPHLFIRDFPERIYHVHMKDCALSLDGRSAIFGSHLPWGDNRRGWNFRSLGHGGVDFDSIIRELNACGYRGPLSVEWEDSGMEREYGAQESLAFVRKTDFAPSGVAFDDAFTR
jgi:sugar phosphate isomerase/epimerase